MHSLHNQRFQWRVLLVCVTLIALAYLCGLIYQYIQ